jgi:hypothetical protein
MAASAEKPIQAGKEAAQAAQDEAKQGMQEAIDALNMPQNVEHFMQRNLDMWQEAASVMTNTASAIMVRQAEIMRVAMANTAHGMLMFNRVPNDEHASTYASCLRQGSEAILDDIREINMLSRDCTVKLFGLYVENYRHMVPHA